MLTQALKPSTSAVSGTSPYPWPLQPILEVGHAVEVCLEVMAVVRGGVDSALEEVAETDLGPEPVEIADKLLTLSSASSAGLAVLNPCREKQECAEERQDKLGLGEGFHHQNEQQSNRDQVWKQLGSFYCTRDTSPWHYGAASAPRTLCGSPLVSRRRNLHNSSVPKQFLCVTGAL